MKLFALTIKLGGLGLLDNCETQNFGYQNSREVKKDLTENIILQNKNFQINTEEIKSKNKLKSDINTIYQQELNEVTANKGKQSKRCIDIIRESNSSNWLIVVLVKEYNHVSTKQQFWESLRLRYNWINSSLTNNMPMWYSMIILQIRWLYHH